MTSHSSASGNRTAVTNSPGRSPHTSGSATPEGVRSEAPQGAGIAGGLIGLLAAAVLVMVVVAQNNEQVDFELLWWDRRIPLAVLLLGAVVLTLIVDQAVGLIWRDVDAACGCREPTSRSASGTVIATIAAAASGA